MKDIKRTSDLSDPSDRSDHIHRLLPKHGGYQKMRSFQTALIAYDATLIFCERFINRRSRTFDQMVQAARSGVQNIAEGSVASGTSKKTELKLTNVARASLEELLRDYEDYLRQHNLNRWDKNEPRTLEMRKRWRDGERVLPELREMPGEQAANAMICLVNQATYLLHLQLKRLDEDFVKKGGFTERLHKVRSERRRSDSSDRSDASDQPNTPPCPKCDKPMRLRTARQGARAGQQFWGCSAYPECRGTRPLEDQTDSES